MEAYKTNNLSLEKVINSKSPSISVLRRDFGEVKVLELLEVLVIDLAEYYNVGKTINIQQLKSIAGIVLKEYYFFKIEDFRLCFDNCKAGHYGTSYSKIDGETVLGWIGKYADDKAERISLDRIKESDGIKANKEVATEYYNKIMEMVNEKEKEKKIIFESNRPEPTKIDKYSQSALRLFDRLYRKYSVPSKSIRMMEINGKGYTSESMLKERLDWHYKNGRI